jgi:hypothetical protein
MTKLHALATLGIVLTLTAVFAVAPAAAGTRAYTIFELCDLGETHYRIDQGPWQACPDDGVVAAESIDPVATFLPCQAGEGLIGPRGAVDPCMVVAAETADPVKAYYVCEAGEGLIGPRGQVNTCRDVAGVTDDPESYYPCDIANLRASFGITPC